MWVGLVTCTLQAKKLMMKVPDRWLDYTPLKDHIEGTRIVAIKTPLKESFNTGLTNEEMVKRGIDTRVPLEKEFTPTQLVRMLQSKSLNLGLVIDLTNTDRYYSWKSFEDLSIEHYKLRCPGHEIPSEEIYKSFSERLSRFLSKESDEYVAVHCTHGVNRTGYLICRYLVEHCGFETEDAIKKFGDARGHNIERENYLKDLRKLAVSKGDKSNSETGIHLKHTPKERTKRDYRERSISPKPVLNFDPRQSSKRETYCDTDWRRSSEKWRSSWSSSYDRSRDSNYWRRSYQYCDRYGQRSYHPAVDDTNWRRRDYDHHHYGYESQWQPPHQRRDHHHYESGPRYGHSHQQDRSLYRDFFDTKPNGEDFSSGSQASRSHEYSHWCPQGRKPSSRTQS